MSIYFNYQQCGTMWISMLLSLCLTLYTISIILYYANQLTPCLSHHTMSITLYYGNHFIYNSPYIPTLIWNFLQYSVSNFAIFEIIFYLSSTWTLISFVCNGFLKSFLFKLQKMVNTWKKKLIFTCLCLFLLEMHSVPLHKVFYISQIIAYFVSTWESRSPIDTPHVNHKHWSGFSNAISTISVPKITS